MATHEHKPQLPRLMVTGASGALGHWICRTALSEWLVYGIHLHHGLDISGVKAIKADLTLFSELKSLFSAIKPRAVIHAAAMAQPALCEADPQTAHIINVKVPRLLATICAEKGLPFVFTSTDLVFDGLKAPYHEQSAVSPVTVYGRQKAAAEVAVLEEHPRALVCRMPLLFGLSPRSSGNFSFQMLSAIQKKQSIGLFIDEFRTPVDFQSASRGILTVLGRREGLLHLGGRIRLSRFELGCIMARYMESPSSVLSPVSIHDMPTAGVTRSPDCTMISHMAYGLGYNPLPLSQAVKNIVLQFKRVAKQQGL